MKPEQFDSEKNYLSARMIVDGFLKSGLLTEEEHGQIDTILLEKFSPLIGKLNADKPAKPLDKSGV